MFRRKKKEPWADMPPPVEESVLACLEEANRKMFAVCTLISEARKMTGLAGCGGKIDSEREAKVHRALEAELKWALESLRRQKARTM